MLNSEDTYRVERLNTLSDDSFVSLCNLYQPLIGGDGVLLYMTLYAEGRHMRSKSQHRHLASVMNMPLDSIERARYKLEEYNLLQTFLNSEEKHASYMYRLLTPLPFTTFLSTAEFMNRLINRIGRKDTEEIKNRLYATQMSMQGYKEITKPFRNDVYLPQKEEVVYTKIEPRLKSFSDGTDIRFDYSQFNLKTRETEFPNALRTNENLELIGRMATIHGLSVDKIKKILTRCVKLDPAVFNTTQFVLLCEKCDPDLVKSRDPYMLPPKSFLQSKMNGASVPLPDQKILEHLSNDFHFPSEVINCLIEHVLKVSDNRLNAKFVDMVAGEWARDGIQTKEQALIEMRKSRAVSSTYNRRKNVIPLPEYMQPGYQENEPNTKVTDEELQNAMEFMKSLGGNKHE